MSLSPVGITALNNLVATKVAKAARAQVEVGTHEVDFTVHVHGSFTVEADTDKKPTVSIPVKEVLALFIARSGCTREAGVKLLSECLTEALTKGVKGEGAIAAAADIDKTFTDMVSNLTAGLPRTPVKGDVTTKNLSFDITMLGDMAVEQAAAAK